MIRKAANSDIEQIMTIVRSAQQSLRELGIDQWQDNYPNIASIECDIKEGVGYVYLADDTIVGYAAIVTTGEEAYNEINDQWLYGSNYVVVHRLCVHASCHRSGIAIKLMHHAANIGRDISLPAFRIDTHSGNIRMQSMLKKLGFRQVGIVHYSSGERVAYELDLNSCNII